MDTVRLSSTLPYNSSPLPSEQRMLQPTFPAREFPDLPSFEESLYNWQQAVDQNTGAQAPCFSHGVSAGLDWFWI